ncbi:hypothetical protein DFQ27_001315, partial [Actinomortierella ambigua]
MSPGKAMPATPKQVPMLHISPFEELQDENFSSSRPHPAGQHVSDRVAAEHRVPPDHVKMNRSCYIIANSDARLKAALAAHGIDYAKDESEEGLEIFRTVARELDRMLNEEADAET